MGELPAILLPREAFLCENSIRASVTLCTDLDSLLKRNFSAPQNAKQPLPVILCFSLLQMSLTSLFGIYFLYLRNIMEK